MTQVFEAAAEATTASILLIGGDGDVRRRARTALERARMDVSETSDGRAGLRMLFARPPDVVVLAHLARGLGGLELLGRIRDLTEELPVLVLSARDGPLERVRCLRAGADDVLAKPFDPDELTDRVRALARRAGRFQVPPPGALDTGFLRLDPVARRVTCDGTPVDLSPLEFRLLAALCRRPGTAVPAAELREALWGSTPGLLGDLSVLVSRLRLKLGCDPRTGRSPVETLRGLGYRLDPGPGG